VLVNDVTLREAEQCENVLFSLEEKVELAAALAEVGVAQVQVGYPGQFERDREVVGLVRDAVPEVAVEVVALAFVEDWEREIEQCAASGAHVVHVVYRSSDRLHALLGVDRTRALDRTREAIAAASSAGCTVAFTPSDCTRADLGFLEELWAAAAEAGASRVYVADSMGAATPELIALLVARARERTGRDVGVHCHDDFGLGVANTLAGLAAGASIADVAVNGLGDRAGNAAMEEVVAALGFLYELDAGVQLKGLTALSRRFAAASGRDMPPNKPVVGTSAFTHVLPTHVAAIRADPRSIQPIEPELVGNVQRVGERPDRAT
jgi:isopropylmalate/homocitrate/citramalate synthase